MARRSNTSRRRTAQTPVAIIGDIRVLSSQELAEHIDPIESTRSLDEALALVGRNHEAFEDQSP